MKDDESQASWACNGSSTAMHHKPHSGIVAALNQQLSNPTAAGCHCQLSKNHCHYQPLSALRISSHHHESFLAFAIIYHHSNDWPWVTRLNHHVNRHDVSPPANRHMTPPPCHRQTRAPWDATSCSAVSPGGSGALSTGYQVGCWLLNGCEWLLMIIEWLWMVVNGYWRLLMINALVNGHWIVTEWLIMVDDHWMVMNVYVWMVLAWILKSC